MSTNMIQDKDSYREQYIRRLHKEGYPTTAEKLQEFNINFYDDLDLRGKMRLGMSAVLSALNTRNIQTFTIPKSMKGNLELVRMFYKVAADCAKKWTGTKKKNRSQPKNIPSSDDETSEADAHLTDPDVDMKDFQEEEDEDDSELKKLKEQLLEKDCENMQLKNRNEELAKTLKMKDDECQQLEEQAEKTGKIKETDMAQLMEEKRSLEERVRSLEATRKQLKDRMEKAGNVKESDVTKLEDKIRSLEEALRKKDIVVETLVKAQDTLLQVDHHDSVFRLFIVAAKKPLPSV